MPERKKEIYKYDIIGGDISLSPLPIHREHDIVSSEFDI